MVEQLAAVREPGTASSEVARFHGYLAERVGEVRPSVLYQRLRAEQGLGVSWGTFYLDVRLGRKLAAIYDGPDLVTSHARRERGRSTRLDHYPDAAQAFLRFTPQVRL